MSVELYILVSASSMSEELSSPHEPSIASPHESTSVDLELDSPKEHVPLSDAQREKMRLKRVQVARELLATEETYVKNLQDLMTVFYEPFESNATGPEEHRVITKDDVRSIFGSLKMILPINKMLLSDLETRLSVPEGEAILVGDSFKNMVR